ncbi:MAG: replicative DNA helicase [Actinomycetota bacterium]
MAVKQTTLERVPPHNLEAEESLLGAMLLSKDAIAEAQELVGAEDFYRETNQKIYTAILELEVAGEPADAITLAEALRKKDWLDDVGGKAYILELVNIVPTAANARYYATIVSQNSVLRKLIRAASEIAALGYSVPEDIEKVIDTAENLVYSVAHKGGTERFQPIGQLLTETYERLEKLAEKGSHVTGVPTGFDEFDKLTSGLQPSDFIVVAGRPGMGKTSFVLSVAEHVAVNEKLPVAIFSLEMSRHQLVQRMMCSEARVNAQSLRIGSLSEDDWLRLSAGMNRLHEAPIWIDDTANITMMSVRSKARRLDSKQHLGLIIIDYMQMMQAHSKSDNRQQEISEISRAMKILGRDLNVPVLAVSQLSRAVEARTDKRPILADLRESGAIEQDADLVVFIYREDYYNKHSDDKGVAEIIVSKHRHGPTGDIRLAFLKQYTKFVSLDVKHAEEY